MLKHKPAPSTRRKRWAASPRSTCGRGRRHLAAAHTSSPPPVHPGDCGPGELGPRGVRTRRRAPPSVTCSVARAGEAGSSLGREKAPEPRAVCGGRSLGKRGGRRPAGADGDGAGGRASGGAPRGRGGGVLSQRGAAGPGSPATSRSPRMGPGGRPGRSAALPGVDSPLPPLAQRPPPAVCKRTGVPEGWLTRGCRFSCTHSEMQIPMASRSSLTCWVYFPDPFPWCFTASRPKTDSSPRTVKCIIKTRPFPFWDLCSLRNKWVTQR